MFTPLFIDTPQGRRFAIHHPAAAHAGAGADACTPLGLVVYVHPHAEEMNKSRRMAALQARALALQGFAVLQIDLAGCGDSEDLAPEADVWAVWLEDVVQAVRWMRSQYADASTLPLWLWGLRAGALVTVEAARRHADAIGPVHLLWWQPVMQGAQHMQQFLRLATAGQVGASVSEGPSAGEGERASTVARPPSPPRPPNATAQLRTRLKSGETLEVAGYAVRESWAAGLESASLTGPLPSPARLIWLEVSSLTPPALLPSGAAAGHAWQQAGWSVQVEAVSGPPFWQAVEIEDAPELLERSTQRMLDPFPSTSHTPLMEAA